MVGLRLDQRPLPDTLTTTRGAAVLDGRALAVASIGALNPGEPVVITVQTGAMAVPAALGIVFLIRARQVWSQRRDFGYTVYAADRWQRRLRWAGWRWMQPLATSSTLAVTSMAELPHEAHLIIPRRDLVVPVIEAPIVGSQWDISELTDEVAQIDGTVYPGDLGNAVLAGHIIIPDAGWGPFQELEILVEGDRVFIERGSQQW